jgi:hypothetical protein
MISELQPSPPSDGPNLTAADIRWKLLLSKEVLTNCYAQRIHACFQYLDTDSSGYFTLKEFSLSGIHVMEHLPLAYDQKSMFAVMVFPSDN